MALRDNGEVMRVTYTNWEFTVISDDPQEREVIRRFINGPGDNWQFVKTGFGANRTQTYFKVGWLCKPPPPPVTLFSRIGNRIDRWLYKAILWWRQAAATVKDIVAVIRGEDE